MLAKAEKLDEKIVPREFINDQHLENHESELHELFEMKATHHDPSGQNESQKSYIVGNVDWRLNIDEEDPWKSSISELWMGKSKIVEWNFLPSGAFEEFWDEINPDKVSIVKNFMIIGFYDEDQFLFLNLLSKKLFWVRENALDDKIR